MINLTTTFVIESAKANRGLAKKTGKPFAVPVGEIRLVGMEALETAVQTIADPFLRAAAASQIRGNPIHVTFRGVRLSLPKDETPEALAAAVAGDDALLPVEGAIVYGTLSIVGDTYEDAGGQMQKTERCSFTIGATR